MSLIAKRLEEFGIRLPHPATVANYIGFTRVGRLLFVSGQSLRPGPPAHRPLQSIRQYSLAAQDTSAR